MDEVKPIIDLGDVRRSQRGEIRITIVLNPNGPPQLITSAGCKLSDLTEAYQVMRSVFGVQFRRYGLTAKTLSGRILEAIDVDWHERHIRKWVEAHKEEIEATKLPWLCDAEGCGRRFETEQGAKIHEKSCRRLKGLPEKEPTGSGFGEPIFSLLGKP